MARTRALMTETERKQIANDDENRKYQAASRIRGRIQDELTTDVAVLKEHHPVLFEELREVVCNDTE